MGELLVVAATAAELCGGEGLVCGVGPVEAALGTAAALAGHRPAVLLHVGVAGAHRAAGIAVGGLVVGTEAVYEDVAPGFPLAPRRASPDPALAARALRALPEAVGAVIGTTARVGGASECPVEAMEGFAVLRAAAAAGVPALELRAISNLVDDPRSDWRLDDALAALAAALPVLRAALA